jgi:hypothetical protein
MAQRMRISPREADYAAVMGAQRKRTAIEKLIVAALDVLHHDRDEDGPETEHNSMTLRHKFGPIIDDLVNGKNHAS